MARGIDPWREPKKRRSDWRGGALPPSRCKTRAPAAPPPTLSPPPPQPRAIWVAPKAFWFSTREWRALIVLALLSKADEPISLHAVSGELNTDQTTALSALNDLRDRRLAEAVIVSTHGARPRKSSPLRWKLA